MTASSTDADSELERLKNELLGDVDALMREAELVYAELVQPHWGSVEHHGLPRTLDSQDSRSGFVEDVSSAHGDGASPVGAFRTEN